LGDLDGLYYISGGIWWEWMVWYGVFVAIAPLCGLRACGWGYMMAWETEGRGCSQGRGLGLGGGR